MIIDFHVHCYPEHIAEDIVNRPLHPSGVFACFKPDALNLRQKMQQWGIDRYVLLPVATQPNSQAPNRFAAAIADDAALCFGSVHPASDNLEGDVEHIAELGLRGIKLHPYYQGVQISDPRYVRIVRRAAKLRLPVVFHSGADPGFPGQLLAKTEDMLQLLSQVEDEEGLQLVAAHMGGLELFDQAEEMLCGRNIFLDTSFVAGRMSPEQCRRMIEKHGYKRILFGSDAPYQAAEISLDFVRSLGLPPAQEQAVLGGNAAKLLKLTQ